MPAAPIVIADEHPILSQSREPAASSLSRPMPNGWRKHGGRHQYERDARPERPICNIYSIVSLRILDPRLHHSLSTTAHRRTCSPTPFSNCSPRSSKRTPADVRASERTVSDTSTSPDAERPLMREAMLTAPP